VFLTQQPCPPLQSGEGGLQSASGDAGILGRIRKVLDRRLAPASDAPLAVAFSGGGDSLALLLAAQAWAQGAGRRIVALTVDHGLQPQSAAWTLGAAATARKLGAEARRLDWIGEKPQTGLPAAARRARHALLAEAAREAGARVILFGHTLDDELEAQLMRREGSTLGGLAEWGPSPAWPQGRGLFLLRPLLGMRRAALRRWLDGTGLDWIEDPANDDPRSARARARRRVRESALEQGRSLEDRASLGGQRTEPDVAALARRAFADRFGVIRIPREAFRTASFDAALRFTALACVCAGGGEGRPRGARILRLTWRLAQDEVFATTLAGARIEAGKDQVRFLRDAGEAARGGLQPLALSPGRAAVWDGRFEVRAEGPGVTILALKGRMTRLSGADRTALKAAPAAARPTLPVATAPANGESLICPILTQGGKVHVRSLVGERLSAACGMIAQEDHANLRH